MLQTLEEDSVMRFLILALTIAGLTISSGARAWVSSPAQNGSKLYVTNSSGDDVTIIDPATLKVIRSLKVGHGPHGLVASADGTRLYLTVEDTQKLLIIDTATDQIIGEVPIGKTPNKPTLSKDERYCYIPLRGEDAFEIVDLKAMKVIKRLPTPAWPHNMYTAPDGKRIYLGSINGGKITVIDPATQSVANEIDMGAGVRPMAISKRGSPIYVALSKLHGFAVFDPDQKKIIRKVELPPLPPDTPTPYLNTYTHGLLLVDNDRELWVTSCPGNALYVFSLPDLKQTAKIETGELPNWLTATTDDRVVFVSNAAADTVTAIDARTKKVLATIPVGRAPKRLLVVTPKPAA
jgi:YVTN family beta-propeller protein